MTKEKLLAALDKPRKIQALLAVVNPGGSLDELLTILMTSILGCGRALEAQRPKSKAAKASHGEIVRRRRGE